MFENKPGIVDSRRTFNAISLTVDITGESTRISVGEIC